jgi:predicted RecA/RadA family phage recombinase
MAEAVFVHEGRFIDYTPASDVAVGDVVVITDVGSYLLGIADRAIAAGQLGSLAIEGVYDLPKGSEAISVGQPLYWDAALHAVANTGGNVIGVCVKAATIADAKVRVKLTH